jgi:hypothetical protein
VPPEAVPVNCTVNGATPLVTFADTPAAKPAGAVTVMALVAVAVALAASCTVRVAV